MRKILYLLVLFAIFILIAGCFSDKSNSDDMIQVNVSISYPEKEIYLEDLAEIEYLQLEFDDEYLYNDIRIIASTKIITINHFNGDVLLFSKEGHPLAKFNHQGNGPNDYPNIDLLIYDEMVDEFFIKSDRRINVYSALGEFKRTLVLQERAFLINEFVNFDIQSFLLYDDYEVFPASFSFLSKTDGTLIETIDIPKNKKINLMYRQAVDNGFSLLRAPAYHIVKYNEGYLLTDFSIDTVFFLSGDKKLSPILVRKPLIQSMDPVIYLNSFIVAGDYEFMTSITVKNENNKLPRTYLMRDKKTGSIYQQKIIFNDYKGKQVAISPETIYKTQDSKSGLIVLSLVELQDANRENRISGRLKKLVENSDTDGNDILMLLYFK
jgi:hypothetical protein